MKQNLIISIFGLIVLLILNRIGSGMGLYGQRGENRWFGKIMHFSGGFFTALFWSVFFSGWFFVITLTFMVGVFWEIGEYFYGVYKLKKSKTNRYLTHAKDTVEDLIFDIVGAITLAAYLTFFV